MIGWLLDTNVAQEIFKRNGGARVRAWSAAQTESTVYISILTIAEFDKGIANLPVDDPRRPIVAAQRDVAADRFANRILPVSDAIVRRWGSISGMVRRDTGYPPPVIDTLLAATAIAHDLYLVTRNVRDVRHSGAAIFDPWTDDAPSLAARRPR